jgi:hypothetical protein
MRAAPSVQALSCGAGPWLSIQMALYALSTAVAVWWTGAQWAEPGVVLALASLLLGLVAAAVARAALSAPALQLGWDGSVWRLCVPGRGAQPGQADLMLDLGTWMLVCFTPADRQGWQGATWLPLSRRDTAVAWPALRVALHAPRPAE